MGAVIIKEREIEFILEVFVVVCLKCAILGSFATSHFTFLYQQNAIKRELIREIYLYFLKFNEITKFRIINLNSSTLTEPTAEDLSNNINLKARSLLYLNNDINNHMAEVINLSAKIDKMISVNDDRKINEILSTFKIYEEKVEKLIKEIRKELKVS